MKGDSVARNSVLPLPRPELVQLPFAGECKTIVVEGGDVDNEAVDLGNHLVFALGWETRIVAKALQDLILDVGDFEEFGDVWRSFCLVLRLLPWV